MFSFEIAARNSRTRDVACPVPVRVRRIINAQIQHRLRHFASILFVMLCCPRHSCRFQIYLHYALATRAPTHGYQIESGGVIGQNDDPLSEGDVAIVALNNGTFIVKGR